jgi:hypothetical protein
VEAVLAFITNPAQTLILNTEGLWINDIGFTQDFKGVFNKEQVIQHLKQNHNFRKESHKITEDNEDQPTKWIMTPLLALTACPLQQLTNGAKRDRRFITNLSNSWRAQQYGVR